MLESKYIDTIIKNELYKYPVIEHEDLIQEGHIAAWKASVKHKAELSGLKTYTINSIKWAMYQWMRSKGSAVKIPTPLYDTLDLNKRIRRLTYREIEATDWTKTYEETIVDLDKLAKAFDARTFYIVYSYYYDLLSEQKIADRLGVSRISIHMIRKRALTKIKRIVGDIS